MKSKKFILIFNKIYFLLLDCAQYNWSFLNKILFCVNASMSIAGDGVLNVVIIDIAPFIL